MVRVVWGSEIVRWNALRSCTVQGRPERCEESWEKVLIEVAEGVASCSRSVEEGFEMVFVVICFEDSGQKKACGRL